MSKEIAIEIATKWANDIWLFGEVDKDCVSQVCKVLLTELDIANNKIDKIKEYITLHTITEEDLSGWHTVLRDIEGILSIIGE